MAARGTNLNINAQEDLPGRPGLRASWVAALKPLPSRACQGDPLVTKVSPGVN